MAGVRLTETLVRSCGRLDLAAPDYRRIALEDIALGLSRLPRFNGQTWRVVSVLEHSLAVAAMVSPRYRLPALLHDAHEYVLGDFTRPAVALLDGRINLGRGVGAVVSAALTWVRRRIDIEIVKAVLADAEIDLSLTAEEVVIGLANLMATDPVASVDDLACVMELKLFGRLDPENAAKAELWRHYSRTEPDPASLRIEWLRAVREEAALWLANDEVRA